MYITITVVFFALVILSILLEKKGMISRKTLIITAVGAFLAISGIYALQTEWFLSAFHAFLGSALAFMEYRKWKTEKQRKKALEEWIQRVCAVNEKVVRFDADLQEYRAKREAARSQKERI